jgi:hypothetical protein
LAGNASTGVTRGAATARLADAEVRTALCALAGVLTVRLSAVNEDEDVAPDIIATSAWCVPATIVPLLLSVPEF